MILVEYWKAFEKAFVGQLVRVTTEQYQNAWRSSSNRTALYEEIILPGVAKDLGLVFMSEEWKIDFTLCRDVGGYPVPEIFIESENVATSAYHEMRKLCCLHAPLKVLIVCAEWSNKPSAWKHGGYQDRLLKEWATQIRTHNKAWPAPSITGVIVAEWNESLKYYAMAFDHFGEVVDEQRIVFEHGPR